MRISARRALLPLISFILSGCASVPRSVPPTASLQETLTVLAERHHVCGVAVAVIKNRKLDTIESTAACSPAATLKADAVFQAASLSKPVFAYAVLKLVGQGKLALDAPVMKYLPLGYRHQFDPMKAEPSELVTDPRLQAITVRMVLNHTSGLPNWASGPLTFNSPPGSAWRYSGEGYVLLQRAVEAVTGQPLDQFMSAEVFKPSAMNHSAYVQSEEIARNLLPGTKANGKPRATMNARNANAAFTLYTTAEDYGKFLVKVLNDDGVMKQISASPVSVDPALGLSWGLGWGIAHEKDDRYIWHWGNNPGYRAFAMASVESGDGFVMLTNGENGLKLAEPIAQKIVLGQHNLFQSSMLGDDLMSMVCNTLGLCL